MDIGYLGTEGQRQMGGTVGTRKCQALGWEARHAPAWAESLSLSPNWGKSSLLLGEGCAMRIYHICHTALKPCCFCTKRRGSVLVWCQLSRTISSCSGQGHSFCKGEKVAQPTYVIVPLDSPSSIHFNAPSEGLCTQKSSEIKKIMGLFKVTILGISKEKETLITSLDCRKTLTLKLMSL